MSRMRLICAYLIFSDCHSFDNLSPVLTDNAITFKNHRITESQNVRGWKGPLWVI